MSTDKKYGWYHETNNAHAAVWLNAYGEEVIVTQVTNYSENPYPRSEDHLVRPCGEIIRFVRLAWPEQNQNYYSTGSMARRLIFE